MDAALYAECTERTDAIIKKADEMLDQCKNNMKKCIQNGLVLTEAAKVTYDYTPHSYAPYTRKRVRTHVDSDILPQWRPPPITTPPQYLRTQAMCIPHMPASYPIPSTTSQALTSALPKPFQPQPMSIGSHSISQTTPTSTLPSTQPTTQAPLPTSPTRPIPRSQPSTPQSPVPMETQTQRRILPLMSITFSQATKQYIQSRLQNLYRSRNAPMFPNPFTPQFMPLMQSLNQLLYTVHQMAVSLNFFMRYSYYP